jgi:RNA polymerase sigma-70 factor (ECF subfamily)
VAEATSDEGLMAAYVRGDVGAFRQLFDRYAPLLLRLLSRDLADAGWSQDLVQQTFLRLHRARFDYRPESNLRPFLVTIALNLKREHLRASRRRPLTPLHDEPPSAARAADEALAERRSARVIAEAVGALPAAQREVITLHWFEGLTFPEIAEILGTTTVAARVRAHRGYERLRAHPELRSQVPDLQPRGGDTP